MKCMGPGTETASSFRGRETSGDRKGRGNTDRWHGLFIGDEEKPKTQAGAGAWGRGKMRDGF